MLSVAVLCLPRTHYDAVPSPLFDTMHQLLVQHSSILNSSIFHVNVTLGFEGDIKPMTFRRLVVELTRLCDDGKRLPDVVLSNSKDAGNDTEVLGPVAEQLKAHYATLTERLHSLEDAKNRHIYFGMFYSAHWLSAG
jgi:hypothetical protein